MTDLSFPPRSQQTIRRLVPILSGAALLAGAVLCEAMETTVLTDSQKSFVQRYVQAIQARDFEKYKRMVHPTCRACYTRDNEDFHRDMFQRRLLPAHWPVVRDFRAKVLQALPSGTTAIPGCPAKPTHVIQLDFPAGEFGSKGVLINIAFENGSWFEVFGCPTPDALQKFRTATNQRNAEVARAETLFASLRDPLLSELKALLREGKKVTAITRYRDASGEDLSTAKRVVELLDK